MKILLDECIDESFQKAITGHSVFTVASLGWKGLRNGELLRRSAEQGFEVFVTVDRNLAFQQNVSKLPLAVVVLRASSNRIDDLLPLAHEVRKVLPNMRPGDLRFIPALEA